MYACPPCYQVQDSLNHPNLAQAQRIYGPIRLVTVLWVVDLYADLLPSADCITRGSLQLGCNGQ